MANKGRKVLIVDADPQCNLTGLTLGLEDYDSLFKFYDSKKNTDIYNSLAPFFSINSQQISTQSLSITNTNNKNLFILAGNIKLSELDIQIATAMTSSNALPILRKFVGAFKSLITRIANENKIEVVLIDMSPSISATNQSILMSSDFFIIPVSPDFYCYQAIDSLSNVLPKWAKDSNQFRGHDDFSLPQKNPKMIGFISQNYRVYTKDASENTQRKMSKAYSNWLEKIQDLSNKTLVPSLRKEDMVIPEISFKKYVDYDTPYHLAGIQNFNSMIPTSQKKSKPMFELTQSDGEWTGATWHRVDTKNGKEYGVSINIEEAKTIFSNLATSVINIIDNV